MKKQERKELKTRLALYTLKQTECMSYGRMTHTDAKHWLINFCGWTLLQVENFRNKN